jgi:predicted GIY-YIG superfamily endonuclease
MISYVYKCLGKNDNLIYVGQSSDVKQRISGHRSTKHWFHEVKFIEIVPYKNREDALSAEQAVIHLEHPQENELGHTCRVKPALQRLLDGRDEELPWEKSRIDMELEIQRFGVDEINSFQRHEKQ